MASTWQVSKLMNRYYDAVGRAAANIGSCPRFMTFKAGYGYVDETTTPPTLKAIPADLEDIPSSFYTGDVTVTYSNGVTLVKCEIPAGAVSAPVRCNMIGVYDQNDELVAVCSTLPDWVTPSETYRAYPAVTFPLEEITNG